MPARITFLLAKFINTLLSEFVPSVLGSQQKLAALIICHSFLFDGLKLLAQTNINLANKECQAVSVLTITGR